MSTTSPEHVADASRSMAEQKTEAPRILIADDNEANLDILRTRLASQGYEIVTAMDGEEALEGARKHQPDLILLDVMMPKRDGFQVCRLLKADPTLPFMPIILVTAKGETRDIIEGLTVGEMNTSRNRSTTVP
jgi:adenylate cyclase